MKTFLGGQGEERTGTDSIWDLVKQFNMYDPMALILAVPPLAWIFFQHECPSGSALRVVGVTSDKSGVKRASVLRNFMMENLLEGINLSRSCKPRVEGSPSSETPAVFRKVSSFAP